MKGRLVLMQEDSEIQRPENCKIVSGSTGEKVCVTNSDHNILDYFLIIL